MCFWAKQPTHAQSDIVSETNKTLATNVVRVTIPLLIHEKMQAKNLKLAT